MTSDRNLCHLIVTMATYKRLTIGKTSRDDTHSSYIISVQNKRFFHDDSSLNAVPKGGPRPGASRTKHGRSQKVN